MIRIFTKAFAPFSVLITMLFISVTLAPVVVAGPQDALDMEHIVTESDPGRPVTVFKIRSLFINANEEYAAVSYTQRTDNGPLLKKVGWIYLSNDRRINYKMGMVTLIRDVLADPLLSVGIQIVPGTENASRRVISAVAIGAKTE